jgi:hypothetical protein
MRTKFALLAGVAALATALVAISSTSAVSKPETVVLRGLPERFEPLEGFSADGLPSTGARAIFTERLYELKGTKTAARIGRTEGLCTVIGTWGNSHRAPAYCVASYSLPGGKILVAGFGPFPVGPGGSKVPIVGGTGAYANARGYVKVRDLPGFRTNNEIHLLP